MNSVHVALRNWDILQLIITNFVKDDCSGVSESERRNLVAVALVCRGLSELSLDALWRNIDIDDIYSLFPLDIIHVNDRGKKSLTRLPATPLEWERFDVYASRVRKLWASPLLNDLLFCGFLRRYPPSQHPFPNLTSLLWSGPPSDVIGAMILICPTLTEVQLSIDSYPNEDENDDAVADLLRSLGNICSRLRKFEYTHFPISTSRSKFIEVFLIDLIQQCRRLEDVHLPVSRDILRALGSLPRLSKLLLEHVTWEDRSQLSLPIQTDELIEEAERFPVLDDLTIQYSHTVSSLTRCFQGSGCFPSTSFTMWEITESDQWSTLAIAEFLRGILRPDRIERLVVFWINRDTVVQNPVGHDPWQALRFLFSIRNLRTFSLDGLFLDIKDSDLEEISRTWPKLRYLNLNVPREESYQSQVSFRGLAHLSNLKRLESVSLMLAPDSTISETMLSPSPCSNSPLRDLTIHGKFPLVTPHAAVMFLILRFPKLKRIHTSLRLDTQEEGRMIEIQGLLKNLRLERRSRGSGTIVEQEGDED